MSEDRLTTLLQEYEAAQPGRARGGVYALSGFNYQLRTYLADFVVALVSEVDVEQRGTGFANALEALSDYTRSEAGQLVCVQVKRTLTRQSLQAAALEFATIDLFMSTRGERALPVYEVVGACVKDRPDWSGLLHGLRSGDEPAGVARFDQIVRENRIRPIREAADPWWRLVAAAIAVVEKPLVFAREALDICLDRGVRADGALATRDRVVECFCKHRRARGSALQCLTVNDFRPSEAQSSEILVGARPCLDLLRHGQYMSRTEELPRATADLEKELQAREGGPFHRLDVFWIEARSGSGKSVFLLQLMEELTHSGARVVWLEDRGAELSSLLEACGPRADSQPDAVFVDDLFSPANRQQFDVGRIAKFVADHPTWEWPLLVTCGPTEFCDALEREAPEGLRVTAWKLANIRPAEADRLKTWYFERTGHQPHAGAAFGQAEGLILSMAFEMRHGNLQPFAQRFRERVEADGLAVPLCLAMALNRLYIWTPVAWFDRDVFERLDAMNRDGDFAILQGTAQAGGYVRLTHPHLSDAIYRAIRQPSTGRAYANDLAGVFSRALHEHPVTARRLLRVLGEGHERLKIVDEPYLAEQCTQIWRGLGDAAAALQGDSETWADLWVSWACWASRNRGIQAGLQSDPLEQASAALDVVEQKWPALWFRLHEAYPGGPPLLRSGHAWLTGREDRVEWAFVWRRLLDTPDLPAEIDRAALLRSGHTWLTGREDRAEWTHVWRRLLDTPDLPVEIDRAALLRSGHMWLTGREDRADWNYVWQRLLDTPDLPGKIDRAALLRTGYTWLTGREDRAAWTHVWERLLDTPDLPPEIDRAALLRGGYTWLTGREDRAEWTHVWRRLLDTPDLPVEIDRAALLRSGHMWLTGREDRADWNYVWQRLLDTPDLPAEIDRAALLRSGYTWLTGREDRAEWTHVWQRLLDTQDLPPEIDRAALLRSGYTWLAGREDRDEWAFVWRRLLDTEDLPAEIDRAALLRSGHTWLTRREDRLEWTFVWQRLAQDSRPVSLSLLDAVARWLLRPGSDSKPEWDKLAEEAIETGCDDPRVVRAAARWVLGHPQLPQSAILGSKVLCAGPGSRDLDDLARWLADWLFGNSDGAASVIRLNLLPHRKAILRAAHSDGWAALVRCLTAVNPSAE